MIRYALTCGEGHDFESWFQSAASFDALAAAKHLSCPDCGDRRVEKSLMAPGVQATRAGGGGPEDTATLSEPRNGREAALAQLRKEVETNSEYVGLKFAAEARAMHDGDIPHRAIYGEARIDEAKRLVEDGVPVAPLPFTPRTRAN